MRTTPSARYTRAMHRKAASAGGLVYSTEAGRMCPACRQPVAHCTCRAALVAPAGDGNVRVSRETRGRGGKGVTVIRGVPLAGTELEALGKALRAACGTGGTVKEGAIELQGDHAERAVGLLVERGFGAKRAGG
jgi:translation initiation factor 1